MKFLYKHLKNKIKKPKRIHESFIHFVFFLNPVLFLFVQAETGERVSSSSNKTPLVLQWEVSHPRNTDQISLIFKQHSVELITNTSSYQKSRVARLGRFISPLNSQLKAIKEQVNRYYIQSRKTVPVSSLIKDPRFQEAARVDPHAPALRINEEEINNNQDDFKLLANIIYKVWEHKWTCRECAIYKKEKKFIVRIVKRKNLQSKTAGKEEKSKAKKQWEISKQRIPEKLFNCIPKENNKVECVDPQFGIFEI